MIFNSRICMGGSGYENYFTVVVIMNTSVCHCQNYYVNYVNSDKYLLCGFLQKYLADR